MPTYHPLKIKNIEKLTPEAVVIGFDVPTNLQDKFKYKAGQYISLKKEFNGEEIRRSYSLCSSPNDFFLEIGVKKIVGGIFSTFATQQLKVGDTLEVAEPEGRFILNEEAKNITAFAAGSGITPIISILKTALLHSNKIHFTLVYGNKTPEHTLFYKELKKLETEYSSQLKIHWLFSQSNEEGARFGRIEPSIVKYVLKNTVQPSTAFYLCGPEKMINEVKKTLIDSSITEQQIYFELFTASKTEVVSNAKPGDVDLEITVDDEVYKISVKKTNTILATALNQKIDVPYSCQGGICCSCIARITEGTVKMDNNQILTDDEIEEGLILTCQAIATSQKVAVNYDDV